MAETAVTLARRARRIALIQAIRTRPELTLEELRKLLSSSRFGEELGELTVRDLISGQPGQHPLMRMPGETLEQAILRVFARVPHERLASGFFCRYMGLERWTAQKVLADMAERGLLIRSGKTSGTRYSLPG